jgi:hypothetical protein
MATITPAYSWPVPTSSDLVKDGATAIEALGDAIDASMNTALGTKKAGMVLLNTISFSGVASQSFNDVFSATYDNYLVKFNNVSSSGSGISINARLRASGTDNTSSNYVRRYLLSYATTTVAGGADTSTSFIGVGKASTSLANDATFTIANPFGTMTTTGISHSVTGGTSEASTEFGSTAFGTTVTTSYDGITFFPASGTFTGSISIYGFNK